MTPPASPPDLPRVSATRRFTDKILTTPSGFIGIDGAFRLLANGPNERGLAVYQIERGQTRVLSPAPKSFSDGAATPDSGTG